MADGVASFSLIAHTLAATAGVGAAGAGAFSLPVHAVSGEGGEPFPTLLEHVVEGEVVAGSVLETEAHALLAHAVSGDALVGSDGQAAFDALAHSVGASMGARAEFELQAHALQGQIATGILALGAPRLVPHLLEGWIESEGAVAGDPALLAHRLAGTISSGGLSSSDVGLLAHAVAAAAQPGSVGVGSFDLLAQTLGSTAYATPEIDSGFLGLPAHALTGQASQQIAPSADAPIDAAADSSLALNLATGAMTTYRGFRFNSFGQLPDGAVLAARDDGLYLLRGETDASQPIEWIMKLPISDLGAAAMKRIAAAYVNYRSSGPIEVLVRPDDAEPAEYALEETRGAGLYRNRVKFGKGMLAANFQVELRGSAGFELSRLDLDVASYSARRR